MADETTKNSKSLRKTLLESKEWHTIESAASLIVLDDVIKGKKWHNNAKIQETYKRLFEKASKAFSYSGLKISVYEAIELIQNNPYLFEAMRKYPDLTRKDLVTAVERFFERELAISLTALYDVIKSENWHDTLEIQINGVHAKEMLLYTCKSLLEDVCKICKVSESIIKKDKLNIFIENHTAVYLITHRYPDINHQHFVAMIERFFEKALSEFTRTFKEISFGLDSEYHLSKTCIGTKDIERDIEYTPEYIKTAKEASLVIEALIKDADKFGLYPRFYPEEEAEPDYSRFHSVSLKSGTSKGYLEVSTTGIMACDEFFYFAPEKPESKPDTPPEQTILSDADELIEQSAEEAPKAWPNPFEGLNIERDDWLKMWQGHVPYLTERQSVVYILKTLCEPKLTYTEIGMRFGISRQRVQRVYEEAHNKVEQNRSK